MREEWRRRRYDGVTCAFDVQEGVLVMWRGFVPAFVKLAPYSIISITLFEKFTMMYTGGKVVR